MIGSWTGLKLREGPGGSLGIMGEPASDDGGNVPRVVSELGDA